MTQQQLTAPAPLPACPAGHAARYILDGRAPHAGGGHFIECACSATARAEDFDAALGLWFRAIGKRRPRSPRSERQASSSEAIDGANLLQFPLPLRSSQR